MQPPPGIAEVWSVYHEAIIGTHARHAARIEAADSGGGASEESAGDFASVRTARLDPDCTPLVVVRVRRRHNRIEIELPADARERIHGALADLESIYAHTPDNCDWVVGATEGARPPQLVLGAVRGYARQLAARGGAVWIQRPRW
ncbi:MAG: hypothetical protein V3V08_02490 [Nannocystaceae bacterium]